jgi:hypothetical protein
MKMQESGILAVTVLAKLASAPAVAGDPVRNKSETIEKPGGFLA